MKTDYDAIPKERRKSKVIFIAQSNSDEGTLVFFDKNGDPHSVITDKLENWVWLRDAIDKMMTK